MYETTNLIIYSLTRTSVSLWKRRNKKPAFKLGSSSWCTLVSGFGRVWFQFISIFYAFPQLCHIHSRIVHPLQCSTNEHSFLHSYRSDKNPWKMVEFNQSSDIELLFAQDYTYGCYHKINVHAIFHSGFLEHYHKTRPK